MRRPGKTALRRLQRVTKAGEDMALARLRRAAAAREETLRALRDLETGAAPSLAQAGPAFMAAGSERWSRWRDMRRAHLNRELAERTASLEAEKRRAATAMGRNHVVRELAARHEIDPRAQ